MLTKDLITSITEQSGMTKRRAEEILTATTSIMMENLLQGKTVQVSNLGWLEVKTKAARVIVHPKTGERNQVPARKQVTFRPSAASKNLINA